LRWRQKKIQFVSLENSVINCQSAELAVIPEEDAPQCGLKRMTYVPDFAPHWRTRHVGLSQSLEGIPLLLIVQDGKEVIVTIE